MRVTKEPSTAGMSAPQKTDRRIPVKLPSRAGQIAQQLRRSTSVVLIVTLLRAGIVLACLLLVLMTATVLIPLLGAYFHQQSGAAAHTLTVDGTIAMWLLPLVFVIVVITCAELYFMRWLWEAGSRRIAAVKKTAAGQSQAGSQALAAQRTQNQPANKTSRRKKKKTADKGSK